MIYQSPKVARYTLLATILINLTVSNFPVVYSVVSSGCGTTEAICGLAGLQCTDCTIDSNLGNPQQPLLGFLGHIFS